MVVVTLTIDDVRKDKNNPIKRRIDVEEEEQENEEEEGEDESDSGEESIDECDSEN